jgi:tryptophan 2,3-dioxygenase
LRDVATDALARSGLDVGDRSVEALAAAWLQVYRDSERWFELYELAEKLVDIDDSLAAWRHKHVLTVERIIGFKRGTGGSAGAAYLRSTLDKRIFPELWALRTSL